MGVCTGGSAGSGEGDRQAMMGRGEVSKRSFALLVFGRSLQRDHWTGPSGLIPHGHVKGIRPEFPQRKVIIGRKPGNMW